MKREFRDLRPAIYMHSISTVVLTEIVVLAWRESALWVCKGFILGQVPILKEIASLAIDILRHAMDHLSIVAEIVPGIAVLEPAGLHPSGSIEVIPGIIDLHPAAGRI